MDTTQSHSTHILLVDDNPTNLKVLSEALQGQGWKTLMAIDGESAIEQAEYARPDLILLDVMMPGIDGFQTCEKLKQNPDLQDVPVIFMTALSDAVNKVKGLELGAVDYITKPFQQEEVIARVKLHLKLSQLTLELERRVQQRTAELEASIETLQNTQLQLIQSEKMSTLGQLVAGIGHEINNPINFVSGNLRHIADYANDLLNLVHTYQKHVPNPGEAVDELIEDIDLPYLAEDLPKLMDSIQQGVVRLRDISASLRSFARADIAEKVEYQIHDGLDSTVMLLKHRLKANENHPEIEVVREYRQLPPISCYPGQLNQVFMNVIANAIDAFEEANQQRSYESLVENPNKITIKSAVDSANQTVTVRIQDNGPGMPEHVKTKIFDQSFTTKPVGKGTGLGLAISRQIILEKHCGQLECHSELGQGTEFVIVLPI